MTTLEKPITIDELKNIALSRFGNLVKAVADVEKNIIVIDADLHSDEETLLLQKGSKQENLWGINLYPDLFGKEDFVEFDSMINLRPSQGNKSRGVDSPEIKKKIKDLIHQLIK